MLFGSCAVAARVLAWAVGNPQSQTWTKKCRKDVLLFYSVWNSHEPWKEELALLLPSLEFRDYADEWNKDEITFVLCYDPPSGLLASLPNLKASFSIAAGIDHLTKDPMYPTSVPIHRMEDPYQMLQMAQYAVHAVLHHHRHFGEYRAQQHHNNYRRITRTTYTFSTGVVVLGMGNMGARVAQGLHAMGFDVYGWSRTPKQPSDHENIRCVHGVDELYTSVLPQCTYVVCTLPYNDSTANILDSKLFSSLQRGGVIVNLGRGGHVNEQDLLSALDSGQLSAAWLDVFVNEPLVQESPLWNHPSIHITPHIGGELFAKSCAHQFVKNFRNYR